MLVITAATPEELREALKLFPAMRHERRGGAQFYFGRLHGRDVALVQTGVGPKKAGAAARGILETLAPSAVIAMGAAGAADPELAVGDIVIATAMLHHSGSRLPADEMRSGSIAGRLRDLGLPVSRGGCFTAATFIHEAGRKRHIFESTGARVIDMESASLARRLHPAGIPFVNIRIVSDTADKDAFNIEAFYRARGKAFGMAAWAYFIGSPRELLRAAMLKKNVRLVARRIAALVAAVAKQN